MAYGEQDLPETTAKLTSMVAGIMMLIMSYGISSEWLSKDTAEMSRTMAATQTLRYQLAEDPCQQTKRNKKGIKEAALTPRQT